MTISSPLLSNTGATFDLATTDCIDWLSLTFPSKADVTYPDWWDVTYVETKPINGYQKAVKYADGRLECWSPERPDMGVHVVMNGSTIDNLSGIGVTELAQFSSAKASFRRFDVARDIFNGEIDFDALEAEIEQNGAITKARSFPTYRASLNQGRTLYIGKKTSDRYARIYDKAYEQNQTGDWTRCEAVYRDDLATPAVNAFLGGCSVVSLIKAVIDFPRLSLWTRAMGMASIAEVGFERKQGNTERWLMEACAPALAKVVYLHADETFVARFWERVAWELDLLAKRHVTDRQ